MQPKYRQLPWNHPQVEQARDIYRVQHLKSEGQVHSYERALVRKGILDQDASMTCMGCGKFKSGHKPHDYEQGMLPLDT